MSSVQMFLPHTFAHRKIGLSKPQSLPLSNPSSPDSLLPDEYTRLHIQAFFAVHQLMTDSLENRAP